MSWGSNAYAGLVWSTLIGSSSSILGAFYNNEKNKLFLKNVKVKSFCIMQKKYFLSTNASEMGDNVLKACPRIQGSLLST